MMRLFIALDLPLTVITECISIQKRIQQTSNIQGNDIPPENLHCTLLFLGQVLETRIPHIIQNLKTITFPVFTATLSMLETNTVSNPHIIWLTLEAPLLQELVALIRKTLIMQNEQLYKPHITLMRLKQIKKDFIAQDFLYHIPFEKVSWHVTSFTLYQSQLSHQGAVYSPVTVFPL
jgi:RNA 2',3'-cyclic 3'-phosphodiesterase